MTIKRLIGTAPSQIPRNKDLGNLAFQNKEALSLNSLFVGDNNSPPTAGNVFEYRIDQNNSTIAYITNQATGSGARTRLIFKGDASVGTLSIGMHNTGHSAYADQAWVWASGANTSLVLGTIGTPRLTITPAGEVTIANGVTIGTSITPQYYNEQTLSYPTIRPTLNLDFAGSESVDSRINFTRSSAATYYGTDGKLKYAVQNEPRIDYDPVTGECKGLLIEEQRTNLFNNSNLGNYNWTGTSGGGYGQIDFTKYTVAPDGNLAYKIHSVSACSTWSQQVTLSTGYYTLSWYQKTGAGSPGISYWINGSFTHSVVSTTQIQTLISGWVRMAVLINVTAGGTGNLGVHVGCWNTAPVGGQPDWCYYYGFQLEAGSFATSYIPSPSYFSSRTSLATYFDNSGVLRTAAAGQARYGYGYDLTSSKWVSQGLIIEPAATNMIASGDYGYGSSVANTTVIANVLRPDNVTGPVVLTTPNAGNTTHYFNSPVISSQIASNIYTFSFFAKPNGYTRLVVHNYGDANGTATFDLSTTNGSIFAISGPALYANISPVANGWYRCSLTYTCPVSFNNTFYISPTSTNSYGFNADGTSGMYFMGWQHELNNLATSYIPTFGATATRAADAATSSATTRAWDSGTIQGNDFLSFYNFDECSVFVEQQRLGTTSTDSWLYTIGGGTGNMQMYQYRSSTTATMYAATLSHTVNQANISITNAIQTGYTKYAGGFKLNDYFFIVNGTSSGTDTSAVVPADVSNLSIGALSGWYKKLVYYPKRLTNAQLTALTTS